MSVGGCVGFFGVDDSPKDGLCGSNTNLRMAQMKRSTKDSRRETASRREWETKKT